MISLPPPPILKVIHRSHHSRCGEEILGSHTGAPTATQGAPTGYKARDIHTVEELRINRGTTARQIYIRGQPHKYAGNISTGDHSQENISGAATHKYISNISTGAPQPHKYITGSHTAPLAFMPSQRNHTKQRHTTRKAKEVKSETEMQNLIMGKQLGCNKFFLLTNYVEKCIHLVADYGRVSLQVSILKFGHFLFFQFVFTVSPACS